MLVLTIISEIALFTAEPSMQRFQQMLALPLSRMDQPFIRALEEVLMDALGCFSPSLC